MKKQWIGALFVLFALFAMLSGVFFGSTPLSLFDIGLILKSRLTGTPLPNVSLEMASAILFSLRVPRVLCGFLIGGSLSVSGSVMQSVLQNPLASSYTLGVSSGASIFLFLSLLYLPLSSALWKPMVGFLGSLLTLLLILAITAFTDQKSQSSSIVMVGIIFSLFINAMIQILGIAHRDTGQQISFWQMGSLAGSSMQAVFILLPFSILICSALFLLHSDLDILSLGDEQALLIGVSVKQKKLLILILTSALTGICVAFAGVIGFIDLIAPHIVRRFFSPSHRFLIPFSFLFGGGFLVLMDTLARTLFSPHELPIGAVTALVGAPFFFFLFIRQQKGCV